MSDDHAIKAISCYGNQDIQTSGLDRLAREGMRFNHALTPNSFCTPARAAVLTGKYSHKNGVTHLNQGLRWGQGTALGSRLGIRDCGGWRLRRGKTRFSVFAPTRGKRSE